MTHRGVTDILLMSGPLCVKDLNLAQLNDTIGIVTSWSPPAEEPVISSEKQSNLLPHPPDMHMQHLIYFMILVWTLTLSGNLAVFTKRRFRAWNKQAAETNNMVLMCHKLYLSALFQTQYSHPGGTVGRVTSPLLNEFRFKSGFLSRYKEFYHLCKCGIRHESSIFRSYFIWSTVAPLTNDYNSIL